jgi:hypothetical protein
MSYYASYFPSGVAGIGASSAGRRLVRAVMRTIVSRARVIHRLLRPITSFDALVPQDMNVTEDVYEWEREGIGRNTNQRKCGQATKPSQARRKMQTMIEITQNQTEGRRMSAGLRIAT